MTQTGGWQPTVKAAVREAQPETPLYNQTSRHQHTDCEVMTISVYPKWPSAAILDFIEPQIAPFDPPTPKNHRLEPN